VAEQTFDLVVLGSGPGGYTAAIRASQLGMKTAIIERELLGGICLNWGCIPTKALLRTSELFHLMHRAKEFGLKADNIGFDIEAVVKRSRAVASQLNGGVKHLMKKNNITVIEGHGKLAGSKSGSGGKLQVSKDGKVVADIAAKNIILATGARARRWRE
jgi:dihydrolipoamide dehydrogenase